MITLVGEHLGRYGNSGEVYLLPKPTAEAVAVP